MKLPYSCLYEVPYVGTIQACAERKTFLSANFEVWSCDRTCVLPGASVVHLLASLTPSSTAVYQDPLQSAAAERYSST